MTHPGHPVHNKTEFKYLSFFRILFQLIIVVLFDCCLSTETARPSVEVLACKMKIMLAKVATSHCIPATEVTFLLLTYAACQKIFGILNCQIATRAVEVFVVNIEHFEAVSAGT